MVYVGASSKMLTDIGAKSGEQRNKIGEARPWGLRCRVSPSAANPPGRRPGSLFTGKRVLSHAYVRFDFEVRLLSRGLKWDEQHGRLTCAGQISDQFGCWLTAHS
jgi:hypothetical protein